MTDHSFRKPAKRQPQPIGVTLDCACVYCDYYQHNISLGQGMKQGHYYFPAFHMIKKEIVQINIYRYRKIAASILPEQENPELARFKSLHVIPYFEMGMFEQNGFEMDVLSAFPHLQSKFNYCPSCEKFGLQFCPEEHLG